MKRSFFRHRVPAREPRGRLFHREMGRHHSRASLGAVPPGSPGPAGHARARLGPHHQFGFRAQRARLAVQGRIRGGQTRPRRDHQGMDEIILSVLLLSHFLKSIKKILYINNIIYLIFTS